VRQMLSVAALLVVVGLCSADVSESVKKLKSTETPVRRQGAQELSEAGAEAKGALEALITALAKDDDRFVRAYAARAIGNVGRDAGKKGREALEAALSDDAAGVRLAAMQSLTKMGPDAIPALGKAVLSGTSDIKEQAVDALGKHGKAAYSQLLNIVKEQKVDAAYRRTALAGLMKLGDDAKPAVKVLTATAKNPRAAGPAGQQFQLDLFAALGTLATKSDTETVALLEGLAKQEKGNPQIKKAAAAALKKIQSR
jgi:HEAT repeat protein